MEHVCINAVPGKKGPVTSQDTYEPIVMLEYQVNIPITNETPVDCKCSYKRSLGHMLATQHLSID